MSEAIAEIGPAAIEENPILFRLDAEFDADARVSAGPLFAIHMAATTGIDIGRKAMLIDRKPKDQAGREVVDDGLVGIIVVDVQTPPKQISPAKFPVWSFLCLSWEKKMTWRC